MSAEYIPYIIPLILIDLFLKLFSLYRLSKDEPANLNKPIWAAIILIISTIGPACYLLFGRKKD